MSDFMSNGWSVAIMAVTVVSILWCFWVAMTLASRKAPRAADGSVDTTGHVWDGDLAELNNPLPRWWLYLFYITCIFGLIYLWMYPGLGSFKGQLGWSQVGQYENEMAKAREKYDPLFDQYQKQDIAALAKDPKVVEMGERLYLTYCVQCHGSDARGSTGFPNLTDNDWLGDGTPAHIQTTILNGRVGVMPPMAASVGSPEQIDQLAHYVISLSGGAHDSFKAQLGKDKFAVCAACHGPEGKGMAAIGAPNLTDKTWLHGGGVSQVTAAINKGFNNQMPSFGNLLGEGKAHVLAAYVWSLSAGGK
ncbi:MAG: cytochrome-c oxidase, cbb3-type subunit III [Burkholderiaceae bacterium]